jgi:hypothetical protein
MNQIWERALTNCENEANTGTKDTQKDQCARVDGNID